MKVLHSIARAPALLVMYIVSFYQRTVSRFMPRTCRFTPTCSEYMIQAIKLHGLIRGMGLGIWRILRCNPFNEGGNDPVPRPKRKTIYEERHRQEKEKSGIYE